MSGGAGVVNGSAAHRVETGIRSLVVSVDDWPIVAAGMSPDEPAMVMEGNRVVAVSEAARAVGVRVGLRRREAQARCPEVAVVVADPSRDAREFEPVVAALATLSPRVEVTRPGRCGFPTRGPSRYFGGDKTLADRARQVAQQAVGGRGRVGVGVADGAFAAGLVAASADATVIPAGASARWLASLPVSMLGQPDGPIAAELVDLFHRLGLDTLGAVAGVPAGDMAARFGPEGTIAHRLASGADAHPPRLTSPAEDLAVESTFDPPVERVDTAAFAARALAEELQQRLGNRGEACTCLLVLAETDHGERLERRWRHAASAPPGAIVDRVRWQLDGWLNGPASVRPTAGITLLRLVPEEVVAAVGIQLPLWGAPTRPPDRVTRAVARLVGSLGPEAVTVAVWRGGRHPGEQVGTVPVGTVDLTNGRAGACPPSTVQDPGSPPWPGRVPSPSPATVFADVDRPGVAVVDETGATVRVDGRAAMTSAPSTVSIGGGKPQQVAGWAGPWPVVERWWEPAACRRQARFQILTDDGSAYLVALERGQWSLVAQYD